MNVNTVKWDMWRSLTVYGVSLAAVAVAVVTRLILEPLLADNLPFITLFLAVGFAAWYGGWGPGLLALVVSIVAVAFILLPPRYSSAIESSEFQVGLVVYVVVALALIAMFEVLRNAQRLSEDQRRQLLQVVAAQRATEQAMAEQAERLRITLASIGDAVITTDTEAGITHMNALAESLTGWTAGESMGHPLGTVFRIVNATTKTTVEDSVSRALTEGTVVGLGHHTLLISKDGTEHHIDGRAAPIRYKDGKVVGCVLVFRDISERHRQEAELGERERQFRALAESIPHMAWMANADGHIFWYNSRWYNYTGTTFEEMQGWGWQSVQDPVELPNVLEKWKASLAAGTPFDMTFPLKGQDGQFRPFLTRVEPLKDEKGRVVRWFGTNTDISVLKEAEDRLRTSEQRTRLATEATGVGIWEWNTVTGEVRWDAMMFQIYGMEQTPNGVVQYSDWRKAVLPEDLPQQEEVLNDTLVRLGSSRRHFRITRQNDGECRDIASVETFRTSDAGVAEWVVGTNLDVTEQKRVEDALRQSVEEVQTLMDTLPIGVFVAHDSDCRMITGNAAAHALMRTQNPNLSKDASPGESPTHFRVCRNGVEIANAQLPVQRAARGESVRDEEEDVTFEDGTILHTLMSAAPLYDKYGQLRGAVASVLDVTGRKRAEEQLRKLAAELSEADYRKDVFLATLAHELRNPLAPIRNGLEVIKMAEANGMVEQARTMMERQLMQLIRLVDDLLDISRVTQGKLELRRERVEMGGVIDAAVETSRPLIEQAGHELKVSMPDESIFLTGDATRLAQVVSNLLTNSAKYTHQGGHIRLTVRRDAEAVVISVTDDGIGIPPAMLDKVFVMFTQVDRALEKSTGGLGIGLSLVKGLVVMHGGTIEVKSDGEGKGSEFVVRLPVVIEASKPQPSCSTDVQTVKSSHRVLVVDDNRDSANSLAMMLRIMGNETRTAYDGQSGVDVAGEFRPDVILFDIGLPKLNGHEACRKIREKAWGKNVLMIAVTGWGQDDDRRRSKEAGFDHHMVKPVDPKALMAMLAGLQVVKQ